MLTILCALAVTQASPNDLPNATVYARPPARLSLAWVQPSFFGVSPLVNGLPAFQHDPTIHTLGDGQAPPGWSASGFEALMNRARSTGQAGGNWRHSRMNRRLDGAPQ
jgi:glycine cleavage system regulatory protein